MDLLFPLLPGCLLARQSLANTARGSANALVRFRFRNVGGMAFGRCDMMLCDSNPEMRGALLVAERTAHWGGTQTLPSRPFVDERLRNIELIHVERRPRIVGFLFRV